MPDEFLNSSTSSHAENLSFLHHHEKDQHRIVIGLSSGKDGKRRRKKTIRGEFEDKDSLQIHHLRVWIELIKNRSWLLTLSTIIVIGAAGMKRCNERAEPIP
jgi:hypothetical protein